MTQEIALVGFGEAGATFASSGNWAKRAIAWDVLPARRQAMVGAGLVAAGSCSEAVAGASLILSVVTADQALEVAKACAPSLRPGSIWCDMNSVAPATKAAAAKMIEGGGGRYVDVAIMAPVAPARLAVPLLVSGASASGAELALRSAGFSDVRIVGLDVGRASAIKMIRSIIVKGLEALTDEMVAAANAAGVADEVFASLDADAGPIPWHQRAQYNLERMATHGVRRAAEMEQVASTLVSLGVEPVMTNSTVRRQRDAGRKK